MRDLDTDHYPRDPTHAPASGASHGPDDDVIDVDGDVVSAAELTRRIETLVGPSSASTSVADDPAAWHSGAAVLPTGQMIPVLSGTVQKVHPPNPPHERGLNAQLRWGVKRTLRKLLGWQNEPRWVAQRELDEQLIHYAATADRALEALSATAAGLRREVGVLRTEVRRLDLALADMTREVEAAREAGSKASPASADGTS